MGNSGYDVVIIGSGHNALTTGCYLQKGGLKCIVLERLSQIGGGTFTIDGGGMEYPVPPSGKLIDAEDIPMTAPHVIKTLPGFKHNMHSVMHEWVFGGPVYNELELLKYGAEYIHIDRNIALVFRDGTAIVHWKDVDRMCKEIEYFSKKDAKTYKEYITWCMEILDMILTIWFSPPIAESNMYALLEKTDLGQEVIRTMQTNVRSLATELFESEELKTCLCMWASQAGYTDDAYGSGAVFMLLSPMLHRTGVGVCKGGSIGIAKAMGRFFEEHGGKIVTNAHVQEIIKEGDKATGVILQDGTKVMAGKAVCSAAGIKQLFYDLIGKEYLSEHMTKQIDRFKGDEIPLFTVHLCLDGPIRWKAIEKRPEVEGMPFVNFGYDNLDDLQSQYNDARMGIPPQTAGGATCTCTHVDPTQAPPGKHSTLLWQYSTWDIREEVPPYQVKKGEGGPRGWDVVKKAYGDYLVEEWIKFAPSLEKDILARYYHSPLDISRTEISMLKGSMMFGTLNDQMLNARPFRSNVPPFRTPLKGLYICNPVGPSIAGCSGAPGYGCANAMAEDLKLKKWWKPLEIGK